MKNTFNKNHRLKSFDYSTPTMYFVTFCTYEKRPILCRIESREHELEGNVSITLLPIGKLCEEALCKITSNLSGVEVSHYVIMPNHIHALISIDACAAHTLGDVIQLWKTSVTRSSRKRGFRGRLWQRNFYDHIVRDERDLKRIIEYIELNPKRWSLDKYYLA